MESIINRDFDSYRIVKLGDIANISDATKLVLDKGCELVSYKKITFKKLSPVGKFIVNENIPINERLMNGDQFRKFLTEGDIIVPKKATKNLHIGMVGKYKDNVVAHNGMIRIILKDKSISLQVQRYLELSYIQKYILDSFNVNNDKRNFLNPSVLKELPIPLFVKNEDFDRSDQVIFNKIQVIKEKREELQKEIEFLQSFNRFDSALLSKHTK